MADSEKKIDFDARLPRACIDRIISNNLSSNLSVSRGLRSNLLDCGISFIQFISIGAHDMCEKEKRKTITPEHVFKALSKFGFENYIKECEETLKEYQKLASRKPSKKNTLQESGLTMEELLDKQNMLFESAKKQMDKSVFEDSNSE